MKCLSGRLGARRLIAVAGAGALLSAGLGAAGASAAGRPAATPGTPATGVALAPCAIKYAAGSLYIGSDAAVYRVGQRAGSLTSIAPKFAWGQACGVAVDGAGNVLVADGGQVVVAAARTGTFYGKRMSAGHVYPIVADYADANTAAVDVQLDPSGNVVFDVNGEPASHTDNEEDSQVFVLAQRAGTFYGKKMAKGGLYLIAGVRNGGPSPNPCDGPDAASANAAAGAVTKATQANLGFGIGTLRFDAEGNIVLADSGGDGGSPCGADSYDVPSRVAVIPARTGRYYGQQMTAGDIYAIAGLGKKVANGVPAIDSDLSAVSSVALDHAGNILVAAGSNYYPPGGVWVIAAKTGRFYGQKMLTGHIYLLPGPANASGVAVDNAGNVLVGEVGVWRVQMLAEKTGGYYGVKARAGRVYTIAGNGKPPL